MSTLKEKAITEAINRLKAAECLYAIVTPDGQTLSNGLEVAVKKEGKRAARKYPYGELTGYYKPLIDFNAPVGSVQTVPYGPYPAEDISHGISSTLSQAWGKGSYMSSRTENGFEFLRIS
jgi:hypothetical protein